MTSFATNTTPIVPKRLSVPLTARDLRDLKLIRESPEHLSALPGEVSQQATESELVHAVFEAGLARVREATQLAGYSELAKDEEYAAYRNDRRAAAGRRRSE